MQSHGSYFSHSGSWQHTSFLEQVLVCEWRFQGFISVKDEQLSQKTSGALIKGGPESAKTASVSLRNIQSRCSKYCVHHYCWTEAKDYSMYSRILITNYSLKLFTQRFWASLWFVTALILASDWLLLSKGCCDSVCIKCHLLCQKWLRKRKKKKDFW